MPAHPGTPSPVPHRDDVRTGADSETDHATAVRRAEGGAWTAQVHGDWDVGAGVLDGGHLLSVPARPGLRWGVSRRAAR